MCIEEREDNMKAFSIDFLENSSMCITNTALPPEYSSFGMYTCEPDQREGVAPV